MGLAYFSQFLLGLGAWKWIQALRTAGIPIDSFLPSTDENGKTVYSSCYVSDISVRFFHFASAATQGGTKVAHIVDIFIQFQQYVDKALFRSNLAIMCFDQKLFVPLSKRPIQSKRRSRHEPLNKAERRELFEEGIVRDWNRLRSTPGAMAWVLKQLMAFLRDGFDMPGPKNSQPSTMLIIHGLGDEPGNVLVFEATQDDMNIIQTEVPIIGEGEIQVAYWMYFVSQFMPVTGVSIDKDLVALAAMASLRNNGHPMYIFSHSGMYDTFVRSQQSMDAFRHRPYSSCPDFTAEPEHSTDVKAAHLPFLDVLGLKREIRAMFDHYKVRVTSPVATWVLFMEFTGCDFVDKGILHGLNGEKLLEAYLALGKKAPSVVRVTLDEPNHPFHIDFAEKVFLEFVFEFLAQNKKIRFERKKVKVAARQACWVLSYWCNAIVGHDYVPDSVELDDRGRSYWGWKYENLKVIQARRVSKTLPAGFTQLVESLKVSKKRKRQVDTDTHQPESSKPKTLAFTE